ncbi:hypothetical protein AGMMS50243_25150 [Betaproteobacteria bacterium]|nr:hypothetical protein AGMMS50243_25150 [Betaproteobacteria bacterium]
MAAHRTGQLSGVELGGADVVPDIDLARLTGFSADREDSCQALTIRPLRPINIARIVDDLGNLFAAATMTVLAVSMSRCMSHIGKGIFERLAQYGLISFDRQQVVGPPLADQSGDIALTAQRIQTDQTTAQFKRA